VELPQVHGCNSLLTLLQVFYLLWLLLLLLLLMLMLMLMLLLTCRKLRPLLDE